MTLHQRIINRITCADCGEDDPSVTVRCGDGVTRCAAHANEAGYCWGCGDGEPQYNGDDLRDGMCFDCRSEDEMRERRM